MGGCSSSNNQPIKENGLKIKGQASNEKEQSKPIEAKIVLLGEQYVGKSSIAQRFCKNLFTGQYVVTIGGAYLQQKIVLSNGVTIKFHIWDTGGQERFRSMANLYYRDASAAILVYDVSNDKSFENINYWVEELNSKCDSDKLVLALAGNKCDIESNEKKIQASFSKSTFSLI